MSIRIRWILHTVFFSISCLLLIVLTLQMMGVL